MKLAEETFKLIAQDVLAVAPARAHDLTRLHTLRCRADKPTVTVIGKYNHGKSRLLNELMGSDVFSVADRRETVSLAEHVHQDVRWLDAPGLDADVGMADDGRAQSPLRQPARDVTNGLRLSAPGAYGAHGDRRLAALNHRVVRAEQHEPRSGRGNARSLSG